MSNKAAMDPLNKAVLAIKKLSRKVEMLEARRKEPIAIVGMGCRFPAGNSIQTYWESLVAGTDAVVRIPESRWPEERTREFRITPWAGLLDDVQSFDAGFFGISPREAASMDPQQRLLLEVCWEALEDAGIVPKKLKDSLTGVFLGISNFDYQHKFISVPVNERDAYTATGNVASISAGRISYVFGLRGPCYALDTACSSSLVSTHAACQSLRNGESDLALAGGVNLIVSEQMAASIGHTQAISPDGRCKTFDASANGYVRGEGCGILVLKRLSDAIAHGDLIWATICGSAINHDGAAAGLTVPSGLAQQAVYRRALAGAQVDPGTISYIETHGTGTALGDPIEIESLAAVYGQGRDESPCWLGAVKTNMGHLESAAGVAGIIKAVLVLRHRQVPPNLHFKRLNPKISLGGTRFAIPTACQPLEEGEGPLLAAVSSFGFSGTNGHFLLSSPPQNALSRGESNARPTQSPHLVTLSAR
ncbi:MAG: polyketide synthase, partial [Proteobacteria bacterium]|nr:polyketide synthase [Pseudomonadota bacterium]